MVPLSLYELNNLVCSTLEERFPSTLWLQAELSEARLAANGHFYVEFIEHEEASGQPIAKARGTIWRNTYNMLSVLFERATGERLRAGLKVLVEVEVRFDELYGYSLNVVGIDPSYTLGDMAKKRREILKRLEADGILEDNKNLPISTMMNRIAVISSPTAAGYGDFCDQLLRNEYGLNFTVQLFPAAMQGVQVEESILSALSLVMEEQEFDAVVIIRGGGATSDLSDFDTYNLAAAVAQFPLPVIVGIGHDRDETILDLVANTSIKTPTAAAAFLIDHQLQQLNKLLNLQERLTESVTTLLQDQHLHLERLSTRLTEQVTALMHRQELKLSTFNLQLSTLISQRFEREHFRLQLIEQKLVALDPEQLLKRGYSMTFANGKLVKSIHDIHPEDILVTKLSDGNLHSKVLSPQL